MPGTGVSSSTLASAGTVSLSVSNIILSEGSTGGVLAIFTISLSAAPATSVTAEYTTENGSALAGVDYESRQGTLTIPAGFTQTSVVVPVISDVLSETNETFRLRLRNPVGAQLAGDGVGTATLIDDDLPTVAMGRTSVVEGNTGIQFASLPVFLSNPSARPVRVDMISVNDSATAGRDYIATNGPVVFDPGVTRRDVTFTLVADTITEPNERFLVRLTNAINATVSGTPGEVLILDDDLAPTISVIGDSVLEGNSGSTQVVFRVVLSSASVSQIRVSYATENGTAISGTDYLSRTGTLTFDPGETEKTVAVTVRGDVAEESNKRFFLALRTPQNASIAVARAEALIIDDDRDAVINVEDATVVEGPNGTITNIVFTLLLNAPYTNTIAVNYRTLEKTATEDDFISTTGKITFVTFEPGVVSRHTLSVAVRGDNRVEDNEVFTLRLSDPTNAVLGDAEANGTIYNDDGPVLSVEDASGTEGDSGESPIRFTVRLDPPATNRVEVEYFTQDISAGQGRDFRAPRGRLTFEPGQTNRTLSFGILGDRIDETNEVFRLHLTNAVNASILRTPALGTIVDNEASSVRIEDSTIIEGSTGPSVARIPVRVTPTAPTEARVKYSISPRSATPLRDYLPRSGSLVFPPGISAVFIEVPIIGDISPEADETLVVQLEDPDNLNIGVAEGTLTIIDDDEPPTVDIEDTTTTECGLTPQEAVFALHLSRSSEQFVRIPFHTQQGSASAGADFTATNGVITIAPGLTEQVVRIPVACDGIDEPIEVFDLVLDGATNAVLVRSTAHAQIIDGDLPQVSAADISVEEGDAGAADAVIVLSLSSPAPELVIVDYATTNGTAVVDADYSHRSGQVVFAPGSVEQKIRIPIIGDAITEGTEFLHVLLQRPFNASLVRGAVEIQIIDNDVAVIPIVDVEDIASLEGNSGQTTVRVPVHLSRTGPAPVTLNYSTQPGSATANEDFVPITGALAIPAGQTNAEIVVQLVGDTALEGNERFTLQLGPVVNATLARSEAAITIIDDDAQPVISFADESVLEGNSGSREVSVNLRLSPASSSPVTVQFNTSSDTAVVGADYVAASGTVTFPPGTTNRTVAITVLGDTSAEPDETFFVAFHDPVNASLARDRATITIRDDDSVAVRILDSSVVETDAEGTNMIFTVRLTSPASSKVTVQYRTVEGTALEGMDYAVTNGVVEFQPGETEQSINVLIIADALDEPDETFAVQLFDVVNAALARPEGEGTILDNDPPAIRISDASALVSNRGPVEIVFDVALTSSTTNTVSVRFATRDGTAVSGADYTGLTGTLVFEPGVTRQSISVPAKPNTRDEEDEIFYVDLTEPRNATIERGQGSGVIFNAGVANTEPIVTLIAPTDGAEFTAGEDISITADAQDLDGTIASIVFYSGDVQIGRLLAPPFTLTWSNVVVGEYTLTALATDNGGLTSTSAPVVVTVLPQPRLAIEDVTVSEDEGIAQFRLMLSRPTTLPVSFDVTVLPLTALGGSDIIAFTNTVTLSPGETNRTYEVRVVDDSIHEATETFRVTLSQPLNATIERAAATGTIEDDDAPPTLSVVDTRIVEGTTNNTTAALLVLLSTASDLPVSFNYATRNVTAVAGQDYIATTGRLTILPRFITSTILVPVVADSNLEADETFEVQLSAPVNATIADPIGVATIVNDDDEVAPTNSPPMVVITRPSLRSILPDGEPVIIQVTATDPDGSVQRVDFFSDGAQIGSTTQAPYSFSWVNAGEGDHELTAQAVDDKGAIGQSAPVRIALASVCGSAAIVRTGQDSEIETLHEYLFELGVNGAVIDSDEASVDSLSGFDLVIWHDSGNRVLTNSDVDLFDSLAAAGKSLYFIGDALVTSLQDLTPDRREAWSALTSLKAGTVPAGTTQVDLITSGVDPQVSTILRSGKVGDIASFTYSSFGTAGTIQTATGPESVLARAGDTDVLVAYWNSAAPSEGRRLTQAFRVVAGGDANSVLERKRLFQNAVWWLLQCQLCSNLNLVPAVTVVPETGQVGQDLVYTIGVQLSGGCEALSVRVLCQLPAGLQFVEAEASRGTWSQTAGVVAFTLGRMPRAANATLELVVRPDRPGTFTLPISLRSLNEAPGALGDNELAPVTTVEGSGIAMLSIQRIDGGALQVTVHGTAGGSYTVESATSLLSNWTTLTNLTLPGETGTVRVTPTNSAGRIFIRTRQ